MNVISYDGKGFQEGKVMAKLVLVPAYSDLAPFGAAVLWEAAAAKYVKMDLAEFRDLVRKGHIKARVRPGRSRLLYLRQDLDDYLRSYPVAEISRGRMPAGEVPLKPPIEEVIF